MIRLRRYTGSVLAITVLGYATFSLLGPRLLRASNSSVSLRPTNVTRLTHNGSSVFDEWSPDGRQLLYFGPQGSLWSTGVRGFHKRLLVRHVLDAAYSHRGHSLFFLQCLRGYDHSVCADPSLRSMTLSGRRSILRLPFPKAAWLTSLDLGGFSNMVVPQGLVVESGRRLRVVSASGRSRTLGTLRAKRLSWKKLHSGNDSSLLAINCTGRYAATGTLGGRLDIRSVATNKRVFEVVRPPTKDATSTWTLLGWSADGRILSYAVRKGKSIDYRAFDTARRKAWVIYRSVRRTPSFLFTMVADGISWSYHDSWAAFGVTYSTYLGVTPALVEPYNSDRAEVLEKHLSKTNGYGPNQWSTWSPRAPLIAYDRGTTASSDIWIARVQREPTEANQASRLR